ncbi:MAG TPA: D-alanine--D-alanine ligase family protein [Rectinemataceae bacterium]|nr:D-alanine--D-alanine ligase family protein [Rectinemataceae bacterium]
MKRIVILYGGRSGEHEVSLMSAASIVRHIDLKTFEPILVGIDKDGVWHLQEKDLPVRQRMAEGPLPLLPGPRVVVAPAAGLFAVEGEAWRGEASGKAGSGGSTKIRALPCDLVFPVLHGTFGEDGTVQGLLEVAGLPYVGASVLGSALGMDKEKAKELWLRAGLPVVPFLAVRKGELGTQESEELLRRKVGARFGWPAFVKPACAGSSVGATKVDSAEELVPAIREALAWDTKVLVEPFVNAREIECSVLGNASPAAYGPGEVAPTHEFYDYEAKYVDPDGARLEVPAAISEEQAERVRSVALAAYIACEISGMARVDFFLDKRTGEVLLNELNTIPGFTHISMYPRMCEAGGISYTALITKLAELAIEKHALRASLRFSR